MHLTGPLDMRDGKLNAVIIAALTLPLVLSPISLVLVAQEEQSNNSAPTLVLNGSVFIAGDSVLFMGENYTPGGTSYELNITCDTVQYWHKVFESNDTGCIPEGIVWNVAPGSPSGLYNAVIYNVTEPENALTYKQEVASASFTVIGSTLTCDRYEYFADQVVNFAGVGYVPGGAQFYIEITLGDTVVSVVQFVSELDGSIPAGTSWRIPLEAANGTYLATAYNDTEPSKGIALAATEFAVNATEAGTIGAIQHELGDLTDLINSSVQTVNVSLIQKLNSIAHKVEQACSWLEQNRTTVAMNMMNAARNMLNAFIHEVQAQRGRGIDEATADQLIQQAEAIIARIDGTISSVGWTRQSTSTGTSNAQVGGHPGSQQVTGRQGGGGTDQPGGNSRGKGKGKGKGLD